MTRILTDYITGALHAVIYLAITLLGLVWLVQP